jgi:uncharacterized membrane protein YqiK
VNAAQAATPELLAGGLDLALAAAVDGRFEAATRLLAEHDAAVRDAWRSPGVDRARWVALAAHQRDALQRLAALRDAAGREAAVAQRARKAVAAYEGKG